MTFNTKRKYYSENLKARFLNTIYEKIKGQALQTGWINCDNFLYRIQSQFWQLMAVVLWCTNFYQKLIKKIIALVITNWKFYNIQFWVTTTILLNVSNSNVWELSASVHTYHLPNNKLRIQFARWKNVIV